MAEERTTPVPPATAEEIITERKRRIFSAKTLVFFLLSLFLLWFLLRKIDYRRTLETFLLARLDMLIYSCIAYTAANIFKTLRYSLLLKSLNLGFFDHFTVSSYQNFFNQILPARTGELTFVYYLKKFSNAPLSTGLHILLLTRIFDFIVVSAFFIGSLLLYYGRQTSGSLLVAGVLFFIISVILLFNLKWLVLLGAKMFTLTVRLLRLGSIGLVKKIESKIDPIVSEFSDFETMRHLPGLAASSLLVWMALYLFSYLTLRAFGIDIGLLLSIAGSTGGVLANVLPINSFGSFGTLEAGWTAGFVLVGVSAQDAITTGFGYHIINFFVSAVLALFCYAGQKIWKR
ncbi:MAG TPA: lysylphosphatidylglycerol synthase transmembrane domain-containing protein [Spirochaetota bacterium]|mgnify:CR=1 FL=1|nr:lysylphosphatidylglycerol synthase transmembrane domain-containing protein [Spirochaetota bacterium]HPC41352.1 lysylphosphatidylglycerol synthase transmembrane domain-containing protein [Spirochaetota bacterium]HPL15447.1 lysylphosphatidylglycerol synthase transmembrane domain-containing protein [Spirochaetota bacterium]HQF09717.1 lysylphosphatidylglycerol synthase transmembrane domain-containing protein [Spirochaetota bacterium]HQH99457.1 lysylphosphatidylglycerol synthase transmembrane dom